MSEIKKEQKKKKINTNNQITNYSVAYFFDFFFKLLEDGEVDGDFGVGGGGGKVDSSSSNL